MPKLVLTDRYIRAIKPAAKGKRVIYWDATQPGLGLRVIDTGTRSFAVVRRAAGSSKLTFHNLGPYPATSLAEARRGTPEVLRTLSAGTTPKAAAEALEAAQRAKEANTFGAVAEAFIAEHLPRLRGQKACEALIRNKQWRKSAGPT